jgi:hypothetical protein
MLKGTQTDKGSEEVNPRFKQESQHYGREIHQGNRNYPKKTN